MHDKLLQDHLIFQYIQPLKIMYIVLDEHKSTFHTNNLILMHFDMIMKIKQIAQC